MNKFLLFLLSCSFFVGYSQDYDHDIVDVVVWQADARSGGKFVGVAPDAYEAQIAVDEVKFIQEGTKYHILNYDIREMAVLINKSVSVQEDFISEDDYLEFKYISEIELIALEYLEKNDVQTAVKFYTSVAREKDEVKVTKHLKLLHARYGKYLFEKEAPETLVTYSE